MAHIDAAGRPEADEDGSGPAWYSLLLGVEVDHFGDKPISVRPAGGDCKRISSEATVRILRGVEQLSLKTDLLADSAPGFSGCSASAALRLCFAGGERRRFGRVISGGL